MLDHLCRKKKPTFTYSGTSLNLRPFIQLGRSWVGVWLEFALRRNLFLGQTRARSSSSTVHTQYPFHSFFPEIRANLPTTDTANTKSPREFKLKALELCPQKDVGEGRWKLVTLTLVELFCGNSDLQVRQTQQPKTRIWWVRQIPGDLCCICCEMLHAGLRSKWKVSMQSICLHWLGIHSDRCTLHIVLSLHKTRKFWLASQPGMEELLEIKTLQEYHCYLLAG